MAQIDPKKIDKFFASLAAMYQNKYDVAFKTEYDVQAAKITWSSEINGLDEYELKNALKNAKRMMCTGDDDWMWPNIGLILSGAKRIGHSSHRPFLPSPERQVLDKDETDLQISKIRDILA